MLNSEERRKVAKTLRKMVEKYSAVEASRVAHALGLEYEVHGTVVAFSRADTQALADLIDPTCHIITTDRIIFGCDRCRTVMLGMRSKLNFCPNCGARVVDDGR